MMIKLLGLIDIIVASFFFFALPKQILFIAAGYLIIKGLIFALGEDVVSYVDVAIGVYVVILAFGTSFNILSIVCALFLAQKGLLSLA